MSFVIKYYRFKDPITGKLSKGYGYSVERTFANIAAKIVDGEIVINKNERVDKVVNKAPRGEDVKEISKEEFDNLDVSEESLTSKFTREKGFLHVQRLEKLYARVHEPLSTDELKLKLQSKL